MIEALALLVLLFVLNLAWLFRDEVEAEKFSAEIRGDFDPQFDFTEEDSP